MLYVSVHHSTPYLEMVGFVLSLNNTNPAINCCARKSTSDVLLEH